MLFSYSNITIDIASFHIFNDKTNTEKKEIFKPVSTNEDWEDN